MALQTKQILVTVMTYPSPSRKYVEIVCCAGVDLGSGSWIRLYPVPYRSLPLPNRFKKYDIIEVRCEKASRDSRVESYKIDQDSIKVIRHLDTKDNWQARRDIVLPTASSSFCEILKRVRDGKSLGLFKPCDIGFFWKKSLPADEQRRSACYAQLSFFDTQKHAVEKVPFDFHYSFRCDGLPNCPSHDLIIVDWEMGQSYRRWRYDYKSQEVLFEKIRETWLHRICSEKNDIYFYVGNMQRFRDQFMVLGVFYPRK
jgi:hypothetical protein